MNIFVCVKQVPDSRSNIRPNKDADAIDATRFNWVINSEDECAVEQALLIREQQPDTSITVIRVGDKQKDEALISALAMGADDAILINTSGQQLDPVLVTKALSGAIKYSGKQIDLVLCGNEAFGDESGQIAQMLAQRLELPCLTRITHCELKHHQFYLQRMIEDGDIEKYKLDLPAAIGCNYGINTPRYAPFPHIQAAYDKPFTELSLEEIGIDTDTQYLCYSNYRLVPEKKTGQVFYAMDEKSINDVVAELVDTLASMNLIPGLNSKS